MVKRILFIGAAAAVIIIIMTMIPTEKSRFKQDIRSFKRAVEQENIAQAISFISPEYRDRNGMDHAAFTRIIHDLAAEFDSMDVSISGLKVFIDSSDSQGSIFASCSLGLRLFARYQGERTLLYGGIVRPASVRAWFKKTTDRYQVYDAAY